MPVSKYVAGDPSAGSPAPADLIPPAATDPEQSLSSGSTTATVEFTHSSPGGTAPITYAISVKDEAGSSVTPNSGSGLGPYVIPVAAGKSYRIRLRATDAGGQIADGAAMVHVAATPGTLGWELVFDGDFTGVTPATQTGSGSGTIVGGDFDSLPWKWTNNSSNAGTAYLAETGLKAVGGSANGNYEVGIDISSLMTADDEDDFLVVFFVRELANLNLTSRGIRLGISTAGTLGAGTNDGMKAQNQSGTTWLPNIMKNDTTTQSYAGAQSLPTEGRLIVRVRGGVMVHSNWAQGESSLPNDAAVEALYLHQISESAKASPRYTSALWGGFNAIFTTVCEWYRLAIYRKGVV